MEDRILSKDQNRISFRKELSYLADAAETFENEKRNAKAEALKKATLQVAAMRQDLAKLIWESVNVNGATIADVSNVSGYSRATVYRFLDEHVENTGGNPGALLDAIKNAQMQKRFEYVGVERGEIIVYDTATGETSPLYIDNWKHEWYYHELSARRGSADWNSIPELDLLVSMVEAGSFVPASDIELLDSSIQKRINSVPGIDIGNDSTKIENVPTFDSWE